MIKAAFGQSSIFYESLFSYSATHWATDKFGIEKIKGARYLPLLTGPSSDYACLHRRRQGLDTCAEEEKGRKTQTEPAFCRPQGRQSL